jgi:hypothetical protein
VTQVLATRLAAAQAAGLGPAVDADDAPGAFDSSRVVDRSRRVKTGEASEPKSGLTADEAWARLERSRTALRDLLRAGDGLALHEITHPHPLFGPLNLYDWVAFLAGHEARHAAQIREAGTAHASTS